LNLKTNQKGLGLVAVMGVVGILAIVIVAVLNQFSVMKQNANLGKTVAGTDSLTAGLLPILSDQNLCVARLKVKIFDARAKNPMIGSGGPGGGPINETPLPLAFSLTNPNSPTVGFTQQSGSNQPTYFPQFGATIGALYFASAKTAKVNNIERSTDLNLQGSTIWLGQVWASIYQSAPAPNKLPVAAGIRLITNNFYVWVKGGKISSCGIIKTPAQFCMDDLGGTAYHAGTPQPCVNPSYPCQATYGPGYYFLGYGPNNNPLCAISPSSCPKGSTVVSNGEGGTKCAQVP
jgi:hypothetical protein